MDPIVFLSHAGIDVEAALRLADRIQESAPARESRLTVWIDRRNLRAGVQWKQSIQEALSQSSAFVVYVGSRGVVNWVWDEVSVALDRAHADPLYPIIPVLGPGVSPRDLPGFLAQYQCVADPSDQAPEAFQTLLRGVLRMDARAPVAAVLEPFVGLRSFDSHLAHLFFGREREVDELVELLRREHLVMVVGDSGSGKSSLVKAGLVPAFLGGRLITADIAKPDNTRWHTVATRPGTDPFNRLADSVRDAARKSGLDAKNSSDLAELVRGVHGTAGVVSRSEDRIRDALLASVEADRDSPSKVLLIVDQFEEIAAAPDAREYARILAKLADPADDRVRVAITMRRDYYYICASFEPLYKRLEANGRRARYLLQRMHEAALRKCIVMPLQLAGCEERARSNLADALLADVGGEPGELALVQMALWRTWSVRHLHGDDLLAAYGAIGRIEGSLAQAAREVFEELTLEEQQQAEALFVRLVTPGELGAVVRRLAQLEEFDAKTQSLARRLAEEQHARLITLGEGTVEITHEQLATQWIQYQQWISNAPGDRRGDDMRVLGRLINDCENWASAGDGEKPKHVAKGHSLESYRALAGSRDLWLSARERDFVAESWRCHVEEAERERRVAKRLRFQTLGIAATAVVALAVLAFALYLGRLRDVERGATLGSIAQANLRDPVTPESARVTAAIAATGWRMGRSGDSWNAIQRIPRIITLNSYGTDALPSLFPTTDAREAATLDNGGVVGIWSTEGEPRELRRFGTRVAQVRISPDGSTLATVDRDDAICLWRISDGDQLACWASPAGTPTSTGSDRNAGREIRLAFSIDGRTLAAMAPGSPLRIWDVPSRSLRRTLPLADWKLAQLDRLFAVSNGLLVAWLDQDGSIQMIAGDTGELSEPVSSGPDGFAGLAFSRDGRLLIAVTSSGTAVLKDVVHGGTETLRSVGPRARTDSISPDGTMMVSSSASNRGNSIRYLTSILDGSQLEIRVGDRTVDVTFGPDGSTLMVEHEYEASGNAPGYADIVAVEWGGREDLRFASPHDVMGASSSRDGRFLATGALNGIASVVRVSDGKEVSAVDHGSVVSDAILTADGDTLATVGDDGLVRMWSTKDSRELRRVDMDGALGVAEKFRSDGTFFILDTGGMLHTVPKDVEKPAEAVSVAEECNLGAFSSNAEWAACFDLEGTLRVIPTSQTRRAVRFEIPDYDVDFNRAGQLTVSADGKYVAIAEENNDVRVFSTPDGIQVGFFDRRGTSGLQFDDEKRMLVSLADDGTIHLIDVRNWRELARIKSGRGPQELVMGTPGRVGTLDRFDNLRFWSTDLERMLDRFCAGKGRNLSPEEWSKSGALRDLPWQPTCEGWESP